MESETEVSSVPRGASRAIDLENAIILDKSPGNYCDKRIPALLEYIDALGVEDAVMPIELSAGQKVVIEGKDGNFLATGPAVVYVAVLPMEAFEEQGRGGEDDEPGDDGLWPDPLDVDARMQEEEARTAPENQPENQSQGRE